jgi:flagellar biosynthesis component FlhA
MTLEERKAAIEAKRGARKSDVDSREDEQYVTDLESVDALEVEHGDRNVAVLRVNPARDVLAQLVKARPNLLIDCGTKALSLVVAKSADEGKG